MVRLRTLSSILLPPLLACGCTEYKPAPLTPATVERSLAVPSADALRVEARQLRHPILKPLDVDLRQGLTPEGAAVVAVLVNPSLRAERDARAASAAQLFTAGILPNPQLTFGEDILTGGTTTGNPINAYALGLNWDVAALLSLRTRVDAARAASASVELDIAWKEWQTAQAARTAVYDLLGLEAQLAQATDVDRRLQENLDLLRKAVDRHQKTILDLAAAEAASQDAHAVVLAARKDLEHQWLTLDRALGLPPDARPLIRAIELPSRVDVPSMAALMDGLENRRLDLVALRRGYDSQEAAVRIAVLGQVPKINLGINKSRDNTNVKSIGPSIGIELPVFDQNQGVIYAEQATRQKLFDEYVSRVFEARSDVATSLGDIASLEAQIAAGQRAIPSLQRLVDTYKEALDRGNVDVLSYYSALNNLSQKRIDNVKLRQQLAETLVALEIAAGEYLPAEERLARQPATRRR